MKSIHRTTFTLLIMATTAAPAAAAEDHKHGDHAAAPKASHHGESHPHGDTAAGRPGNPQQISRTIRIAAQDIKYDKSDIQVKPGETIEFIVTNTGKLRHEFMLGDADAQLQHAEMMKQMPDMVHEDASTLTIEPGETKTLVWQFTRPGQLEVACHVPGHYEAGMKSKVNVRR